MGCNELKRFTACRELELTDLRIQLEMAIAAASAHVRQLLRALHDLDRADDPITQRIAVRSARALLTLVYSRESCS